jgi:hypothetical protein
MWYLSKFQPAAPIHSQGFYAGKEWLKRDTQDEK